MFSFCHCAALRPKKLETCDPAGVRCGILGEFVPPGAKCFHFAIVRLAVINVFIVPLCALRPKKLETCDPKGSGLGFWGNLCRLAVINVFIVPLCALR